MRSVLGNYPKKNCRCAISIEHGSSYLSNRAIVAQLRANKTSRRGFSRQSNSPGGSKVASLFSRKIQDDAALLFAARNVSSRVYSPLTCCVSVTYVAPHSSIQTLSRVYNSNFAITFVPLIRSLHSSLKKKKYTRARHRKSRIERLCF